MDREHNQRDQAYLAPTHQNLYPRPPTNSNRASVEIPLRKFEFVGLKLTAEEVADGIKERERQDPKIAYGVLDPSAFAVDGGPSIAERMARAGVWFRAADNKRVSKLGALSGWDQLRSRLVGDADGRPMLFVFSSCADIIRTLPALQHTPTKRKT